MKKSLSIKCIVLFMLLSGVVYAQAHGLYSFMYNIQRICKAYQIDVKMDDIKVEQDYENNIVAVLELDARRTNYDSVMMIGFYSVGRALEITANSPNIDKVSVEITVADRRSNVIISTVNVEDLIALEEGILNPLEFRKRIESI